VSGLRLGRAVKEDWLCINAAAYLWNYHLPLFRYSVYLLYWHKSTNTDWLCINAAAYLWNYHLPLFRYSVYLLYLLY
jgi:hypothetical protein